jgi:hypothetical protein
MTLGKMAETVGRLAAIRAELNIVISTNADTAEAVAEKVKRIIELQVEVLAIAAGVEKP